VAYAHEPFGEDVHQGTAEKLDAIKGHELGLVGMSPVFPAKGHSIVFDERGGGAARIDCSPQA